MELKAVSEGKGKIIYAVKNQPDKILMFFKDSLTAFNGKKKSAFKGKGRLNRNVSSLVFRCLKKENILSHWVQDEKDQAMLCRKLEMIPLEVVLRNRLAGSTAEKFNIPEGVHLQKPLVEFYYKEDSLQDPFLSREQALLLFNFCSEKELDFLEEQAKIINEKLKMFFNEVNLELIDFKLEFGRDEKKQMVLADEFSCDSCRLWEKDTGEKRDKDRFRKNLGQVQESYEKVHDALLKRWEGSF